MLDFTRLQSTFNFNLNNVTVIRILVIPYELFTSINIKKKSLNIRKRERVAKDSNYIYTDMKVSQLKVMFYRDSPKYKWTNAETELSLRNMPCHSLEPQMSIYLYTKSSESLQTIKITEWRAFERLNTKWNRCEIAYDSVRIHFRPQSIRRIYLRTELECTIFILTLACAFQGNCALNVYQQLLPRIFWSSPYREGDEVKVYKIINILGISKKKMWTEF